MKNWMSRLALLAIVGSIVCSALMIGCGGGSSDDASNNAAPANTATKKGADDTQ